MPVSIESRAWFNPALVSRNFLVPGSIAVVMTIIGALLTSLVVAREWERGTMEALLATPVTKGSCCSPSCCPTTWPWHHRHAALPALLGGGDGGAVARLPAAALLVTSVFLGSALGLRAVPSTVMRSQFNAAQAALIAAFLPAVMLSGFVFEIASMPPLLRAITHLIPARPFASSPADPLSGGGVF